MTVYSIKKGRNFHEYNGVKYDVDTPYPELAWESLEYDDRHKQLIYKIWGYAQGNFPCPMCRGSDDVVFIIESTGVVAKCNLCKVGILLPPMDPEDPNAPNKNYAELLHSEIIPLDRVKEDQSIRTRMSEISKRLGATELPPIVLGTNSGNKRQQKFGKYKPESTE